MVLGISKLLVSFAIHKSTYKFHIVRKVQYAFFSHKLWGKNPCSPNTLWIEVSLGFGEYNFLMFEDYT